MDFSTLSVKRPVTTVMFILIVVLIGFVSVTKIPIDLYPNIEIPVAIIQTTYSNVSPEEIENLVTKPIEESIGTVANIDTIQSITTEGSSIVIVAFDFGTDMDFATLEMREKIDMVKGYLPDDASDPMVLQIDINASAVVQVALSGADVATLYEYADSVIGPALERIEGVASVSIDGGYQNYVSIKVDTGKLSNYGLTIEQLSSSLAAENINLPAGSVNKGDKELLLRTIGEFKSLNDIKQTPILLSTGGIIRVQDVAEVAITNEELTSISKVNGESAVSISVQKQSGTNTVAVASEINKVLGEIGQNTGYDIKVVVDQSKFIIKAIDRVSSSAIVGGLLAVFVLFIFLRSFRSTIIIALSMPISIIATGILIYFNGITLNMMTLGGITLGIGMLVDNSVVVLENIYRFVQEGYDRKEAAILGAKEVAMAVTASTLTTVAVFLPMVFVEGITSIMFKEFSLTVTFSLLSSLVVSLTLIPMMASKLLVVDKMQGKHHKNKFKLFSWLLDMTDKIYNNVDQVYKNILKWSLKHRKSIVAIAMITFTLSIICIPYIGMEFMPETDEGSIEIGITLEDGSKISDTSQAIDEVIDKISDIKSIDYIFSSTTGSEFLASGQNEGTISITLVSLDQREVSVFDVVTDIQERLKDIPGIKSDVAAVSQMNMLVGSSAVEIQVKGDEFDVLGDIADEIAMSIESVEGTRNVSSSLDAATSQVEIYLNRNNASRFGLTTYQVSSQVQAMLDGKVATKYKLDGDELDVVIEGDSRYKESIDNLKQLEISTSTGISVPLNVVADIKTDTGAVTINREDLVRIVTVSSDIYGRDVGTVNKEIEAKVKELDIPSGYTITYGGSNKNMAESFSDLAIALLLAIVLVYMIIAAQFESLLIPFIIMFSVPLAFAGGLFGLFVSYRTINITSIIGFIMLSGIVVNNAIVLLDYIGTRRKMGEDRYTAITTAGPLRLRPILMTTLTTILGLIPLSLGIGEGTELMTSMGTVVIGGLAISTLLTLIVIPVIYSIFDDLHMKVTNMKKKSKEVIIRAVDKR
jgi:HAE1 family hydrophobic/amphiphilic exporter-1